MNERKVLVTPAAGLNVRQPNGKLLPAEGKAVMLDTYWQRRLNDGDVTVAALPESPVEE